MSGEQTTGEKKLSFGFAKMKPKTSLVASVSKEASKSFKFDEASGLKKKDNEPELIKSIQGSKINSTVNRPVESEASKLPVIPCQKNRDLLGAHKKKKEEQKKGDVDEKDMEAVKALMQQAEEAKKAGSSGKGDSGVVIEASKAAWSDVQEVEDADYSAIALESFGMAALRGMGWNEKVGIGSTNKRVIKVEDLQVQARPKGLGLGAGSFGKAPKKSKTEHGGDEIELSLKKGAYVEVTGGQYENQWGQVISMDFDLDRALIKLHKTNEMANILQFYLRPVSRSEFDKATRKY